MGKFWFENVPLSILVNHRRIGRFLAILNISLSFPFWKYFPLLRSFKSNFEFDSDWLKIETLEINFLNFILNWIHCSKLSFTNGRVSWLQLRSVVLLSIHFFKLCLFKHKVPVSFIVALFVQIISTSCLKHSVHCIIAKNSPLRAFWQIPSSFQATYSGVVSPWPRMLLANPFFSCPSGVLLPVLLLRIALNIKITLRKKLL